MSSTSSASPTKLEQYAGSEAARAADLEHTAHRLAATLGHFAATCIEFSTGVDSSMVRPLHDHARATEALGERTAAVGRQFATADQGPGPAAPLPSLLQMFRNLALQTANGQGFSGMFQELLRWIPGLSVFAGFLADVRDLQASELQAAIAATPWADRVRWYPTGLEQHSAGGHPTLNSGLGDNNTQAA